MQFAVTRYAPRTQLPVHARSASYVSLVVAGSYMERIGGEIINCSALSLRLHPAGEEHTHEFGPRGGECLNFEVDESWFESLRRLPARARPLHVQSTGGVGLQLVELLRHEELWEEGLAETFGADLRALCERQAGIEHGVASRKSIRRVIEVIEADLVRSWPLTRLAAAVGLHPTHLARSFKAATGLTIGEYIRKRRRETAEAMLLEQPQLGISRVAAESGFADHAHLTRAFKTDVGVTPSEYRARLLRWR
jgi:AraC family transcriptional regulator